MHTRFFCRMADEECMERIARHNRRLLAREIKKQLKLPHTGVSTGSTVGSTGEVEGEGLEAIQVVTDGKFDISNDK